MSEHRLRSGWLISAAVLPLTFWSSGARHPGWHIPTGWNLLLVLLVSAVILGRERRPITVLTVVAVLDMLRTLAVGQSSPESSTLPFATILALFTLSSDCSSITAWTAAVSVTLLQFAAPMIRFGYEPAELLYINWALVGTVLGRLNHERRARLRAAEQRALAAEQTRQAEADRQVTAERMRIARDLHDVLAHHIAVVNAQAGVAQYLLREDPDAAEQALVGITTNSRAALDELRVTLGLLRDEHDPADESAERVPTPGVAQLNALLDGFREAQMDITATVFGNERPLHAAADLALYRIAQEALSNASKHSRERAVQFNLVWAKRWVELTVTNLRAPDASEPGSTPPAGTGHGLIGMRERALTAGGTLIAGPVAEERWQVKLALPIPSSEPAAASLTQAEGSTRPDASLP